MAIKPRKRPGTKKPFSLVLLLILLVALLGGYRLYTCLYPNSPQFNYIVVTRDGVPLKILKGETVTLHPSNRLHIQDISTNICFNHGVRLVSTGMDINDLLYEDVKISALLPGKDIFKRYNFPVEVKYYTQEIGKITLVIEPHAADWIGRVKRTIGSKGKISVLKEAIDLGYKDRQLIDMLAEEYMKIKDWKNAALLLERAMKETTDEGILRKLLEVYGKLGKTDKIESVLKKLIKVNPDNTSLKIKLAEEYSKSGRIRDAIVEYNKLLKIVTKTDRLPIYKELGYLYAEDKQPGNAVKLYLQALEMDKQDINLYYNISSLYERMKMKDRAEKYLAMAVDLKPGDIDSRLKLAEDLIGNKRYKEAERYLNQVIKKKPDSLEAWLLFASLEEKRGNKKALESAYETILSIEPNNKTVIYNLGALEYESGKMDKAAGYFKKYLKYSPGDVDARILLFGIYRKQKKDNLAYKEALKIVKARPKKREYYGFIFEYLNNKQDYKSMSGIMETGYKKNPGDIDIEKYLIIAYIKTGKEKEAVNLINRIMKTRPRDVTTLMELARLYEKLGRPNDAISIYKRVMALAPNNEEAQNSYLRLRLEVLK